MENLQTIIRFKKLDPNLNNHSSSIEGVANGDQGNQVVPRSVSAHRLELNTRNPETHPLNNEIKLLEIVNWRMGQTVLAIMFGPTHLETN